MTVAVIAAAGITALAIFFFLAEGDSLTESHARVRTHILNTTRWALVIALSWVLIPIPFSQPDSQRGASIVGLAVLIGAVMLIPLQWFVRLGGREPVWELRRAKVEMAQIANKIRRDRGSVPPGRIQDVISRVELLRTPAKSQLCNLMVAELTDLLNGAESWNEAGRRSIRIDELCREQWPGEMPDPECDPDEATFRWHLYRTFGHMMEIGAQDRTLGSRRDFCGLEGSLEKFRRPDTSAFIDAVRQSAQRWLDGPAHGWPWIASFDFEALGPQGLAEVKRIWPRDAVLWGAHLDAADSRALEEDLARRSSAAAPVPKHSPEPAVGLDDEVLGPCDPEPSIEPKAELATGPIPAEANRVR
jgi:hypothetical protein